MLSADPVDTAPESIVRFATAGSVDDGKSTFIGRLLFDTGNLALDHRESVVRSERTSGASALALLTDGLKAEREQNITIDVAYRYFRTKKRRFILADSPGHVQYTRNMATAASQAQSVILLIDAKRGISEQTKRHALIASLLGVPRLLVAVNKMDLVDFSEARFRAIQQSFSQFAAKLHIRDIRFIPVCAAEGDNFVRSSERLPWHTGETVLEYLENIFIAADENLVDVRFPVQLVLSLPERSRGYAGSLLSGRLRAGEEIVCLPSGRRSRIEQILCASSHAQAAESAGPDQPVLLILQDELDISRGDLICRPGNIPQSSRETDLMILWFSEDPVSEGEELIVKQGIRETRVELSQIHYLLDPAGLERHPGQTLRQNDIGRCTVQAFAPLIFDTAEGSREMRGCIFISPISGDTVGAGIFLGRGSISAGLGEAPDSGPSAERSLHRETSRIDPSARQTRTETPAKTLWLTGLSGSGKSTIARVLEQKLFVDGYSVVWLDGDTLRHGLCSDLGFSRLDRTENLRRSAHVARLFQDKGFCVICSFLSPFREDREMVRQIIGADSFLEIHLSTPLDICESRDPHGLYRRARAGEIPEFTGVSAPYEDPAAPALRLNTAEFSSDQCVETLYRMLVHPVTAA